MAFRWFAPVEFRGSQMSYFERMRYELQHAQWTSWNWWKYTVRLHIVVPCQLFRWRIQYWRNGGDTRCPACNSTDVWRVWLAPYNFLCGKCATQWYAPKQHPSDWVYVAWTRRGKV